MAQVAAASDHVVKRSFHALNIITCTFFALSAAQVMGQGGVRELFAPCIPPYSPAHARLWRCPGCHSRWSPFLLAAVGSECARLRSCLPHALGVGVVVPTPWCKGRRAGAWHGPSFVRTEGQAPPGAECRGVFGGTFATNVAPPLLSVRHLVRLAPLAWACPN